jgi:hypothetical protein
VYGRVAGQDMRRNRFAEAQTPDGDSHRRGRGNCSRGFAEAKRRLTGLGQGLRVCTESMASEPPHLLCRLSGPGRTRCVFASAMGPSVRLDARCAVVNPFRGFASGVSLRKTPRREPVGALWERQSPYGKGRESNCREATTA